MNSQFDMLYTSYNDAKDKKFDYVVLPWGATEPHNYHLPYLTDCYLAHDIAVDAARKAHEKAGVCGMILPPVTFGSQNPGQWNLPFCIHTRYETQKAILTDIVSSLHCQGFDKLIILNGHGGNSFKNMFRDLAVDFPDFILIACDSFKVIPMDEYFEEKDDHAGEMETSVLMHYRPELVDLSVAGEGISIPFKSESLRKGIGWMPRNWSKVSRDTGTGNPMKSTAEKGKRYTDAVTSELANLFIDVAKENIYHSSLS